MVVVCSVPGSKRSRACTFALDVAAQAEDASRDQPHEHTTSQPGPGASARLAITRSRDPPAVAAKAELSNRGRLPS
jgi:hypothetical protein